MATGTKQRVTGTGVVLDDSDSYSAPGVDIVAVTKHDSTLDPAGPFRGLVFSGAGDIVLLMASGQTRTIPSGLLATNVIHPLRFTRVNNAGTTATGIYGVK